MQDNMEVRENGDGLRRYWPLVLGLGAVLFIICTVMGAAAFLILDDQPPSVVLTEPPATVAQLPTVKNGLPTSPATAAVPLTPQTGDRSADDPFTPELGNGGYDVQRYVVRLALDPGRKFIEGATLIEATSDINGLAQLTLDFIGYEINAVSVNNTEATFRREGDKLVVDLPNLLPAGAAFTLVISYRGEPIERPSQYLHFVDHLGLHFPDGESIFVIAEPDGARFWFPANDHPRDKAIFRFELLVPAGLTAVANGTLVEKRGAAMPDGRAGELFIWEHQSPMATYLALAAVGQYQVLNSRSPGGIPLQYYVFPGVEESVADATAEVGLAIDWFSELLGPYPFESFGIVTARIVGGSMETQSMVLLSEGMIGRRTVIHELAHMWFGDWVSLDTWREMWRNEGFATYFQLLWENRESPEDLELQLASIAGIVEGNDKKYQLDNPPPEFLFELNIYYRGALAVHALRQEMGDEAFFTGLRAYFQRFGGGTADDGQFRTVMEEAAGRSLDDFFAQWFSTG